ILPAKRPAAKAGFKVCPRTNERRQICANLVDFVILIKIKKGEWMALTATETARVQKFTADMDEDTAAAMLALFEITKPGCTDEAYDLMHVAHGLRPAASQATIHMFGEHGLVTSGGIMPEPVKLALRRAVAERYLTMHHAEDLNFKPPLRHLIY